MEWYEDEVRWLERTRNLGLVDPPPVAVYSGSSLWGGRPCCPRPRSPSYFIVDLYISKWPSPAAGAAPPQGLHLRSGHRLEAAGDRQVLAEDGQGVDAADGGRHGQAHRVAQHLLRLDHRS